MKKEYFKHIKILSNIPFDLEGKFIKKVWHFPSFNFLFKDKNGQLYLVANVTYDNFFMKGISLKNKYSKDGKKVSFYLAVNERELCPSVEKLQEWQNAGVFTDEFVEFVKKILPENRKKQLKNQIDYETEILEGHKRELEKIEV